MHIAKYIIVFEMKTLSHNTHHTLKGNALRKSKLREVMIVSADALYEEFNGDEGGVYEATTLDFIVKRNCV